MKRSKVYFRIAKLIYKELTGSITTDELQVLEDWINASKKHKSIYEGFKTELDIEVKQEEYQQVNIEKAWEKLENRLNEKNTKKIYLGRNWIKYAAAILLPIVIGTYLLFQLGTPSEELTATIIPSGTQKASLVLSNGEVVNLKEKKDTLFEGIGLNKENLLAYELASNKLAERLKEKYHELIIPVGGEYELKLSDGTKVWLNSLSSIKFPTVFLGATREVAISGEAYFEVTKDASRPFIVRTNDTKIEVLGTSFNIKAYHDENINETTLVEGSVRLSNQNNQEVKLYPGQQGITAKDDLNITVKNVQTQDYTSWKDGEFIFREKEMEEIMRTLERWYDVETTYSSPELKELHFTGDLKRYEAINTHLDMISLTTNVEFIINENVVEVKTKK